MRAAGFTLIEVLLAVAVVTLVAAVLLNTQTQVVRASRTAAGLEAAGGQAERLFLASLERGTGAADAAGQPEGWIIERDRAEDGVSAGGAWQKWTVATSNQPRTRVTVYLRADHAAGAPPPAR